MKTSTFESKYCAKNYSVVVELSLDAEITQKTSCSLATGSLLSQTRSVTLCFQGSSVAYKLQILIKTFENIQEIF